MKSVKQYLQKLTRGIFHRGETFALEGGIYFGPASDPKGSFFSHPKLEIYWYQPGNAVSMDEPAKGKSFIAGWITRIANMI